jgi:hypothetical protein
MDSATRSLTEAFNFYLISHQPPALSEEVAGLIVADNLSRKTFNDACAALHLEDPEEFKGEMLDLLLFYVEHCLQDHALSREEKLNIRQMKRVFYIEEGDFLNYRRREIKNILDAEVSKILEDQSVNRVEALYQVDLQAVFDLSYDQYLDLTREHIEAMVNGLIARITSNGIVTDDEQDELLQRFMALDTVYKLDSKLYRMINLPR